MASAPPGASAGPATQQMQAAPEPPATEGCPLCGAPLASDQEWCLQCGAAARTRLAATPNWKAPAATIAVTAALALGVLAAALVKLAGDSGPAPTPSTRTVTTPAASTSPAATVPGAATVPPATTTGASGATTPGVASTPTVPPSTATQTTPAATAPGGVTNTSQAGGTPAR